MMNIRVIRHFLCRMMAILIGPLLLIGAADTVSAALMEANAQNARDSGFASDIELKPVAFPEAFWQLGADGEAAPSVPTDAKARVTPRVDLPVPAAIWMFGSGLGALVVARRRFGAWRRDNRPTTGIVRPARSIPPRNHQVRQALRERMRHTAAAACAPRDDGGSADVPSAPGGRGGSHAPGSPPRFINPLAPRFDELVNALLELPDVALGRRFGMPCVKLGKRPLVAFDRYSYAGIAFRIGEANAADLHAEMPQLDYWNPKHGRQPKLSWLVCNVANTELLVHLAAIAYEQALKSSGKTANQEGCYPAAVPNHCYSISIV